MSGYVWVYVCVCMYVCLSVRSHKHMSMFRDVLCPSYLWPWLGPAPTTVQYVMYFRFYGWRHVFTWCACTVARRQWSWTPPPTERFQLAWSGWPNWLSSRLKTTVTVNLYKCTYNLISDYNEAVADGRLRHLFTPLDNATRSVTPPNQIVCCLLYASWNRSVRGVLVIPM